MLDNLQTSGQNFTNERDGNTAKAAGMEEQSMYEELRSENEQNGKHRGQH